VDAWWEQQVAQLLIHCEPLMNLAVPVMKLMSQRRPIDAAADLTIPSMRSPPFLAVPISKIREFPRPF
jgi:hypothetical protein